MKDLTSLKASKLEPRYTFLCSIIGLLKKEIYCGHMLKDFEFSGIHAVSIIYVDEEDV